MTSEARGGAAEALARDRRALASVATQFFVNGVVFASFLPRLPELRDRLDLSVAQIGLLLSVAGASGLLGSAAVGRVIPRFGTRRVLVGGGLVLVAVLPVVGLAPTAAVLLGALMVLQWADVLVDSAMNLQGSWLSARRHTPVMSRLHGLWSLGTLVGGVASSRAAATGVSLEIHLTMAAAVLFIALVYVGRGLLSEDGPDPGAPSSGTVSAEPGPDHPASGPPSAQGSTRWLLGALWAGGLFAVTMESGTLDWAAFRIGDDFGRPPGFAALGYVAITVGMTSARFLGDFLELRWGTARLATVANSVTAVGLVSATLGPSAWVSLFGFVGVGVGVSTMAPALYDRAARYPGPAGVGLGALTAGLRTAMLTIPLVIGAVAGVLASVGTALAVVTLPALAGYVLVTRRLARWG